MNLAVLRVEGPEDFLATIERTLGAPPTGCWSAGERSSLGTTCSSSGLTFEIADAPSRVEMVRAIKKFAESCVAKGGTFIHSEGAAELSIGVTVGGSEQFVASVDLPVASLGLLATLGIGLSVTAYPSNDG